MRLSKALTFLFICIGLGWVACAPSPIDSPQLEEPQVQASTPSPASPTPPACRAWPEGVELTLFPLNQPLAFQVRGDGLPPETEMLLTLHTSGQATELVLEYTPTIQADGSFLETVTLPEYDTMRWIVQLHHPQDAVCLYLVMAGEEWLEMGVEQVDSPANAALLQDAQQMADDLGISLDEALARLDNQLHIGLLQSQLQAQEPDTFAGLWVEHDPIYRIMLAFTSNSAARLEEYVPADHPLAGQVSAVEVVYSMAELTRQQQQLEQLLQSIDFSSSHGISQQTNKIELYVTDLAAFEAALATAEEPLPPAVEVMPIYTPLGPTPDFPLTPVPDVFMPQLKMRDSAFMQALLIGELVIENGCLRVETENERYTVIWQADYYLTDTNGRLEILDETGTPQAVVGERLYLGGGEVGPPSEDELRAPLAAGCLSPYWRMGQFLPEEYRSNVDPDYATPTAVPPAAAEPPSSSATTPALQTGQVLLYAQGDQLWRARTDGTQAEPLSSLDFLGWSQSEVDYRNVQPRLSPDGRYIAQLTSGSESRLLDLLTGEDRSLPAAWELAWSPNGRYLALAALENSPYPLLLLDMENGETRNLIPARDLPNRAIILLLAWSADSSRLAFNCCFVESDPYDGTSYGDIRIIEIESGNMTVAGETQLTIGGGPQGFCWTSRESLEPITSNNTPACLPPRKDLGASDLLYANWEARLSSESQWIGTRLYVTLKESAGLLWEREFNEPHPLILRWSTFGDYLFVDNTLPDTPILRFAADGSEEMTLLQDAMLIDVVSLWESPN